MGRERLTGIKELLPLGLNRVGPGPEQAEEPKMSFPEEPGGVRRSKPIKIQREQSTGALGAVDVSASVPGLNQDEELSPLCGF